MMNQKLHRTGIKIQQALHKLSSISGSGNAHQELNSDVAVVCKLIEGVPVAIRIPVKE